MKKVFGVLALLLVVLMSCSVEPEEIHYGTDACHFCKMNIVDKQHAAQYVTTKGKQFKFDAIECMVQDLIKNNKEDIAFVMVASYGDKPEMVSAKDATFLISKEIKSPMGAFLSAFKSKEKAVLTKDEVGGTLYTWETLHDKFEKDMQSQK